MTTQSPIIAWSERARTCPVDDVTAGCQTLQPRGLRRCAVDMSALLDGFDRQNGRRLSASSRDDAASSSTPRRRLLLGPVARPL